MSKPNIAVLMATYNGADWVIEQIDSIKTQAGVSVSLYISDDQSTDGTKDIIGSLVIDKVIQLSSEIKFGSAGANFLRLLKDVDVSSFDYIAFSDQDDIWLKDKLSNAIDAIKSNDFDGYSSNVIAFWENGTKRVINKSQAQQKYDYIFESSGPGCTFVFTQKLAVELQNFLIENQEPCKEVALHDWFTYAFARSRGYKWFIDRKSYVMYRQHEVNVVGANVGFKAKLARWEKMRAGWYRDQVLLLGRLLGYDDKYPILELKRYHLLDRCNLIFNFRKLRRGFRDSLALALFFLVTKKK